MIACVVLLVLGAILLPIYIREKVRAYSARALLLKAVESVLFVSLGLCAWFTASADGAPSSAGLFVVLGLVCGLLGDVWLDLKYVFPAQDTAFTYAGFVFFAAGHVLFMTGLLLGFYVPENALHLVIPAALSILLGGAVCCMEKPMGLRYGKLKPVVLVYGILLFGMVALTGSLAILHGFRATTLNLFFIGGVLFALSDLVLSGTYFGEGKERPIDLIANYLLYYPAQFLLALSMLFLK